jgi:glutamate receptor, ionotropic, invertebrate
VDFNAYGFIPTIERVKDFDFTIPVQQDQYRFLVKYPEAESRLWGPIRPFQLPVWIWFLFAIMAVILSLSWLMKCVNLKPKVQGRRLNGPAKHRRMTLTELVGRNAVYICTIITGQGEYFHERKLPVRILVAIWCLMALILVNSYTGNLISYLTVPKMKPVVNSFEELANSQDTKLTIEARNILSENILVKFTF